VDDDREQFSSAADKVAKYRTASRQSKKTDELLLQKPRVRYFHTDNSKKPFNAFQYILPKSNVLKFESVFKKKAATKRKYFR
jgi:hypothetical protein